MDTALTKSQSESAPLSPSAERIVEVATRLFADGGFDGVSTRQIAAAAGLNIATVHHHVGAKRDLHRLVIHHLYDREAEVIRNICGRADTATTSDPDALRALLADSVDAFIDLTAANPERARLYMRRWLDPEDELREEEASLTLDLYRALRDVINHAQEAGIVHANIDVGLFLRSIDWMIMSYFVAGDFDWDSLRADPLAKERVARFKSFLNDYMQRMLAPK